MTQLVMLVGGAVAALGVVGLAIVVGWRTRSPLLFKPLIRLQRTVINPRQLQSAGQPGSYASVIRHVGRASGRPYVTPVGAVATSDGFVVALMYGAGSNWLQNVLASGSATVIHDGQTQAVDRPEVVPMRTVVAQFGASDRRAFRVLGVDQALRLRRVEPAGVATGEV